MLPGDSSLRWFPPEQSGRPDADVPDPVACSQGYGAGGGRLQGGGGAGCIGTPGWGKAAPRVRCVIKSSIVASR